MQGGPGIPAFHWYGEEGGYNILVIELLGRDLDSIRKSYKKLGVTTLTSLATKMLLILEHFHNNYYIHRDIKPSNFVLNPAGTSVYIIDFGLSKRYRNKHNFTHISYRDHKDIVGTVRYSSLNTHRGIEQSRRDDMECMGYTLVYLGKGGLPWQQPKGKTRLQKYMEVQRMKEVAKVEELCEGLGKEFAEYIKYCRALKFEQRPDYSYLQRLFKSCFYRQSDCSDFKYDWVRLGLNLSTAATEEEQKDETNQALALGTHQVSEYSLSISQNSVDLYHNETNEAHIMKQLTNRKWENRQRSVGHRYTKPRDFNSTRKESSRAKQRESSLGYVSKLFNIRQKRMMDCEDEKMPCGWEEGVVCNYDREETLVDYNESLNSKDKIVLEHFIKQQKELVRSLNQSSTTKSEASHIDSSMNLREDTKDLKVPDLTRAKHAAQLQMEINSDYVGFKRAKKPSAEPQCNFPLDKAFDNPPGTLQCKGVECDVPDEKPVNFRITMPSSAARVSLRNYRPKKPRTRKERLMHMHGAKTDSIFKDVRLELLQGPKCKADEGIECERVVYL
eukprot:TRINITY_DN12291_c0_g3_i1.p1 TRINITY_DN12291_c0_g3~~TRINITY_DN12291_c0_g3_i1.p1  ORF type:complete len:559 (-),score=163.87 TRINITY_DN12291_c0_g3_i1:113-1789(-)